jgi:C_GCAxxG_C_C family probable redox protein
MTKTNQTVTCFNEGFSCSQAVFSTYAVELGMERATALRTAGAFGGGIAGRGETCGAVTGALMALGLKYGKSDPGDQAARDKTYALAHEFIERFEAKHGSILCSTLTGCDMTNAAQKQAASESGIFKTLCPELVRTAAQILEEIW